MALNHSQKLSKGELLGGGGFGRSYSKWKARQSQRLKNTPSSDQSLKVDVFFITKTQPVSKTLLCNIHSEFLSKPFCIFLLSSSNNPLWNLGPVNESHISTNSPFGHRCAP